MTRTDRDRRDTREAHYRIENGTIRSPGKFEGCPSYALHFYDQYLDGCADDESEAGELLFKLFPCDVNEYPELAPYFGVAMDIDSQGFVHVWPIGETEYRESLESDDQWHDCEALTHGFCGICGAAPEGPQHA